MKNTLKILSELYREAQAEGKECNAYYATRSTALTKQLAEAFQVVERDGSERVGGAQDLIRKTYFFRPACYGESEIDVLLVDEAHRVQAKSNDQSDGTLRRGLGEEESVYCPLSQTLSLIYCAKVTVFFIDDHQSVKNQEIGASSVIEDVASNYQTEYNKQIEAFRDEFENRTKPRAERKIEQLNQEISEATSEELKRISKELKKAKRDLTQIKGLKHLTEKPLPKVNVFSHELTTQFRCLGADRFVKWVDYVLFEKNKKEVMKLDREDFDFQIIDTPQELEQKIRELNNQDSDPKQTARLVAGWCWDWTDKTDEKGDLKKEVQIGDWAMPWETKARPSEEYRNQYARNADFWARDLQGINQVGCIYSAQGFEFDYVGVILGPDIRYDSKHDCLICLPSLNKERNLTNTGGELLIRNIYRVLLTRGRKGCYMFSCDPKVSCYFRRFINE